MRAEYFCLYLISVLIASFSQILLKISAGRQYETRWKEYLNIPVAAGYGLMAVSMLLTMFAYRGVPLSFGPVIESLGYVFVAVLGFIFLKEKLSRRKMFGMALIIAGIWVIQVAG